MQLEVTRMIAEAMRDEEKGIAAWLDVLPRDAGDAKPVAPVVVCGLDDEAALKGEQCDRGVDTLVLVAPDGPTRFQGAAHQRGEYSVGKLPVAVSVIHRGSRGTPQKVQDAAYIMRAAVLAMQALMTRPQEDRVRNEIKLLFASDPASGLVQDDGVGAVGALVFTVTARDERAYRSA